jgi:hypothetical protein
MNQNEKRKVDAVYNGANSKEGDGNRKLQI